MIGESRDRREEVRRKGVGGRELMDTNISSPQYLGCQKKCVEYQHGGRVESGVNEHFIAFPLSLFVFSLSLIYSNFIPQRLQRPLNTYPDHI